MQLQKQHYLQKGPGVRKDSETCKILVVHRKQMVKCAVVINHTSFQIQVSLLVIFTIVQHNFVLFLFPAYIAVFMVFSSTEDFYPVLEIKLFYSCRIGDWFIYFPIMALLDENSYSCCTCVVNHAPEEA